MWITLGKNLRSSRSLSSSCLSALYQQGLKILSFHLLDHIVDDLDRFGTILLLSASMYDHFDLIIKQSYACTSKRLKTRTGDTVRDLDSYLSRQQFSVIPHQQAIPCHVSRGTSPSPSQSNLGLVTSVLRETHL